MRTVTRSAAALVTLAKHALLLDREEFAHRVGSSVRTVSRWQSGETIPVDAQLVDIAKVVYPHDRKLAAEIAAAAGETLDGVGLEPPPQPPPPVYAVTPRHLAATVLSNAAEALDMSPRAVRPAIAAALRTMCELRLSPEVAEQGMREADAPASKPGRTTKRT